MLQIENVRKSYHEANGELLPILDIPSFHVGAGEQVVLRGRSGCGKTTLLNCIAGMTTVDSGSIKINNTDIVRLTEVARDRFRARYIGFTALENVLLGMSFTGQKSDAARAEKLLKDVGLGHRLDHKPSALSVGEQQRVAVARALANKPALLLADEPTANVDPAHQQQIIDLLREACERERIAMLLVTHSSEVSDQFQRVEYLEQVNLALGLVKAH
jgi:ABC-type lipoprotein export system ATPase subunit